LVEEEIESLRLVLEGAEGLSHRVNQIDDYGQATVDSVQALEAEEAEEL
jgi:hypothetical protein